MTQTLTWESDINYRQRSLTSLEVKDRFTNTHELVDVELQKSNSMRMGREQSYTRTGTGHPVLTLGDGVNGFVLTLPKNET
ncbi:hypothetical protein EVJ22_08055 [Exiguobacterium sp. SH0S7]|nr:hypothetical protein EVJ22_08055 [Exiguobacterium sp. SH0S7]